MVGFSVFAMINSWIWLCSRPEVRESLQCFLLYILNFGAAQKNKATSYHLGLLKAKLAKLRRELLTPQGGGGGGGAGIGFDVARTGVGEFDWNFFGSSLIDLLASVGFVGKYTLRISPGGSNVSKQDSHLLERFVRY